MGMNYKHEVSIVMSSDRYQVSNSWTKLAAVGAALALAFPVARAAETLTPGTPFPALAEAGLEGELPDLGDARVVVVDFWASWCGPCKASFPVYDDLQTKFGDDGLVVVAVSVDKDVAAMEKFIARMAPKFTVMRDAQQQLVKTAAVPTMPTSFVIDRRGVVRFVHVGFHGETSRREYEEEIKALLEEPS